jgi:hypothetical protein
MVLQRFLCNKDQPRIGHLVTSLLCSPAEAKVYEKEQKFLKLHGNKGIDTEPSNSNVATKIENTTDVTSRIIWTWTRPDIGGKPSPLLKKGRSRWP